MKVSFNRPQGLGRAAVLLVFLVLLAAGTIGWILIRDRQTGQDNTDASVTVKPSADEVKPASKIAVPEGFTLVADKNIGIQFALPSGYGPLTEISDIQYGDPDIATYREAKEPEESLIKGMYGNFRLLTYKKGKFEITSRKYGPTVKLQDGRWVITKLYDNYNPKNHKVGDIFQDYTAEQHNGLTVYTFRTGDEGASRYNTYFVRHGNLHLLETPTFQDGSYSYRYNGDVINDGGPNDKQPFDTLHSQILTTIQPY